MKTIVCGAAACALLFAACTTPRSDHTGSVTGSNAAASHPNAEPAGLKIIVEHLPNDQASPQFKFTGVPVPSRNDAAAEARVRVFSGLADDNSGGSDKLIDGGLPTAEDQPE